ncbi:glucosamine 6-phosphate N-acetyltransferase [Dentipellis sp. KUC8613]|nr:glucosamine 6-phosphate N-acetyltransferase [Dentipellis sp. KUC8613]
MPFTPDDQLELTFPPELIPQQVRTELHKSFHIRPLATTDYHRGHLDVLRVLTHVTDPGEAAYRAQLSTHLSAPSTYFTLVLIERARDRIVGVGTVFLERKFSRALGVAGHLEDVAVAKRVQGLGLGVGLVRALTGISERFGAYKTVGNCSDANIPLYKKCGAERRGNEMAKYVNERALAPRARL